MGRWEPVGTWRHTLLTVRNEAVSYLCQTDLEPFNGPPACCETWPLARAMEDKKSSELGREEVLTSSSAVDRRTLCPSEYI